MGKARSIRFSKPTHNFPFYSPKTWRHTHTTYPELILCIVESFQTSLRAWSEECDKWCLGVKKNSPFVSRGNMEGRSWQQLARMTTAKLTTVKTFINQSYCDRYFWVVGYFGSILNKNQRFEYSLYCFMLLCLFCWFTDVNSNTYAEVFS